MARTDLSIPRKSFSCRSTPGIVSRAICRTKQAVGPIEGEEGISTLARAFLLAGTRTVVSFFWTIDDDSTLYLIERVFFAELARKRSVPRSAENRQEEHAEKVRPTQGCTIFLDGLAVKDLRHHQLSSNAVKRNPVTDRHSVKQSFTSQDPSA